MGSRPNHSRQAHRGMDANYNAYGRDDDYPGYGGQFEAGAGYDYDVGSGAGAMPRGANSHSQQGTMPMPNARGRAQAGGAGGAGMNAGPGPGPGPGPGGSRNRSHSRGAPGVNGMGSANRGSPTNLASIKHNIQHRRCRDETCDKTIAWRNAEECFVAGSADSAGSAGNAGLNASGSLGPMHANQDERDYQMKLMDILNQTGLPLADLADSVGFKGGVVPSFDRLPAVSARADGGLSAVMTGAGLPQQQTRAWECARYAVESDRREFYFRNRAIAQNVIFSHYCKIHTCRYFFSREQCMQKKIPFDAVCNTHTTCPVQNCPTAKTQNVDPQQSNGQVITWLRDEFCKTHGCAADKCGYRCDQTQDGVDLRFCPAHRCHYRGCIKQGQPGRGYCSKHKCQSQACQKIAQAGFELCKKHIECTQDKCLKPRSVLSVANISVQKDSAECGIEYYDRKAYLLYCSDHAYCAERTCALLRKKPAVFCFKHVCNETGCGIATTEELKFCNKHRCGQPKCIQPKAWKDDRKNREDFCLGHLCRESDCSQGVGEDHLYCTDHECEVDRCTSKDTGGNFCFNHAHVRSQKKGEFDAHAKTERLARVLQTSRAPPDYPGYHHYAGHPFTSIGSVYAEGSTSSRSSRSSHRHHSRHASTSTQGRKRHSGTSYASSFDEDDEDAAEWTDDSSRSRGRRNRDAGGSGSANINRNANGNAVPMHGGPPPQTRQPMPGPSAPRPQASQPHPPMPNGGSMGNAPGGPGGPGGPSRPGFGGPNAGPAQSGVRGGPPPNTGSHRSSQGGMANSYNDDETGGQFR